MDQEPRHPRSKPHELIASLATLLKAIAALVGVIAAIAFAAVGWGT